MKSLSRLVAKTEPSLTLALSALAKKLHAEGVGVVTLTAGEPDFPTPFHIKEAAKKAIEDNGARRDIVAAAEKVQSQVTSNASSISQHAALAALTGPDNELRAMAAEFLRRRDFIHNAVATCASRTPAR